MITIFHRAKRNKDLEFRKVEEIKAGVWVHVENPTADELQRLVDEAGLDEGMLADATDPHEVPRVEKEGRVVYMYTRVPVRERGSVTTSAITVIVTSGLIVTISQKKLDLWRPFFDTSIDFLTTQRTTLFFLIFREISKDYQRFLNEIRRGIQRTSVNLEDISNKDIVGFVTFERTLNEFVSALVPTTTALNTILGGKMFKLYEDDSELIEDLTLSNGQLIEACSNNLKTIVNIRNAYSTIVTNNLNHTIKLLTGLTIVLTVPTMIASFFGMNVALPFASTNTSAFWLILGVSALLAIAFLVFFVKDKR